MTDRLDAFTVDSGRDLMPEPTHEPTTSAADEQRRIWQLYETARLNEDQATLELLRVGLADRRAKRAAAGSP